MVSFFSHTILLCFICKLSSRVLSLLLLPALDHFFWFFLALISVLLFQQRSAKLQSVLLVPPVVAHTISHILSPSWGNDSRSKLRIIFVFGYFLGFCFVLWGFGFVLVFSFAWYHSVTAVIRRATVQFQCCSTARVKIWYRRLRIASSAFW